jgi:hypothetical protein
MGIDRCLPCAAPVGRSILISQKLGARAKCRRSAISRFYFSRPHYEHLFIPENAA